MRTADTGHCVFGGGFALTLGPETLRIRILGKVYFFEWHHYFGPQRVDGRTGDLAAQQPEEQSPFWKAVQWWFCQGKRLDDDGFAMWDPVAERVPITKEIGPRSRLIVGYKKEIPNPFA